jgi:hypothetical protein
MEDISKLLREARPLYRARKRKQKVLAFGAGLALCLLVLQLPVRTPTVLPIYDVWSEEIDMTENGSPIEDMGLPVDEYGLLMVG